MSASAAVALRTVAFADLETGTWGAAWAQRSEQAEFACLGTDGRAESVTATVDGWEDSEDWRLTGSGAELTFTATGAPSPIVSPDQGVDGFEQLCQVRGSFIADGIEHTVDSVGRRGTRVSAIDFTRYESVRDVSAWFGADDGVTLLALRPSGAKGHDRDVVTASLFGDGGPVPVSDPRLSTTYTVAGRPARVSLELWLGELETEQYPRRAAGEALGPRAQAQTAALEVEADLFRWHSRGLEGAGVYLLAQTR
jgi:hypothetical protein